MNELLASAFDGEGEAREALRALRKLGDGVDGRFVKEVEASMQPGTSALFLVFRRYDPTVLAAWLQPYTGRVSQTTLSPELAEQLDQALHEPA